MKRRDNEEWEEVVKQLIGYLRQILREQLDRRFVFGFTLGPRCMSVCLHDRSGVLITSTPIDIHKVSFIYDTHHIMIHISCLSFRNILYVSLPRLPSLPHTNLALIPP